ncbi:hypothetical protein DPMN_075473 [Dreissena polymorpha]|uniref:Uncharacterized protein n=1 Tax=Dreissena polymorpha TaxID=45954 RepID=A0A9D3YKJ3_DREPO|nr:hypothetical protein DPMN_075473 [Dreissena polymorpha]
MNITFYLTSYSKLLHSEHKDVFATTSYNDGRCGYAVADYTWMLQFTPCNQSGKLTPPLAVHLLYSVGPESTDQHLARIGQM